MQLFPSLIAGSLPVPRLTDLAAVWPPTAAVAHEAGHERQSPLQAIRAKCLDCSCYVPSEVRLCEAVKCPLWPFRAGRHPWYGLSEKTPSDPGDLEQSAPSHQPSMVAPPTGDAPGQAAIPTGGL
jgi:hypothetical protein